MTIPIALQSPLNTIRDIILATDTSMANGTRQLYKIPDIYDMWLTKITAMFVSTNNKVIRIYNTPPGENAALFFSATNGPTQILDWQANPVLLPPKTIFSLDTDILSGALQYHHTSIWGILTPTNITYWN